MPVLPADTAISLEEILLCQMRSQFGEVIWANIRPGRTLRACAMGVCVASISVHCASHERSLVCCKFLVFFGKKQRLMLANICARSISFMLSMSRVCLSKQFECS